jgi:hypothetical protein
MVFLRFVFQYRHVRTFVLGRLDQKVQPTDRICTQPYPSAAASCWIAAAGLEMEDGCIEIKAAAHKSDRLILLF